jgi:hypothetical protein
MTTQNSKISAFDLSQMFMTVKVSVSMFGNNRQAKTVAQEMEAMKGATIGKALKASKMLLDPDALKPVSQARNAISTEYRRITSVWDESAFRLVPNHRWDEYCATMQPLYGNFSKAADDVAERFYDLVNDSRTRLGSMFDRDDYPDDQAAFRKCFEVDEVPEPLKTPDDAKKIRSLPIAVVERIETSMQRSFERNVARVQGECFDKLFETVSALRDSLDRWARGEQKSVHSTVIETIERACNHCSTFNVAGDAHLTALIEEARNSIAKYSMEEIKADPVKRIEVEIAATNIAAKAEDCCAKIANMNACYQ